MINGSWYIWININTEKKPKGSMGQRYTYDTRWEKNIMVIIHIYGARAILLIFFVCQDTESESQEM